MELQVVEFLSYVEEMSNGFSYLLQTGETVDTF